MKNVAVIALAAYLLVFTQACRKQTTPEHAEIFTSNEGSTAFDATCDGTSADGSNTWNATYNKDGKTAKFHFTLGPVQTLGNSSFGFGRGKFVAVVGSQPDTLIATLAKTLQAKRQPKYVQRVAELPFEYADLGAEMSRNNDGSFQGKPAGHWRVLKLFLADENAADDAEVFFNVNSKLGKGEFSIKDPDYGDDVLAKLAQVL